MDFNIGNSRVIESREVSDGASIRRRRETPDGRRFTTYERVERPNLAVVKKDGVRELFDRDKLYAAVHRSVGKFFDSELEVESVIAKVEDGLYALGESEIKSRQIGDMVLTQLALASEVAYVRFASVYLEFRSLNEFEEILGELRNKRSNAGVE